MPADTIDKIDKNTIDKRCMETWYLERNANNIGNQTQKRDTQTSEQAYVIQSQFLNIVCGVLRPKDESEFQTCLDGKTIH